VTFDANDLGQQRDRQYTLDAAGGAAAAQDRLVFECLADVEPVPISWLWPGRLATCKVTLLSGEPGIGKSQIAAYASACITTGDAWPDAGRAPLGSVVILSAEDGLADTLRPRLEAAQADLRRVHVLKSVVAASGSRRTFSLQADLERLAQKLADIGDVKLVTVDPITSYMGQIDSHRTTDVRSVLEPVADFADKHNVSVLAISHPPKAATSKAINGVTGSLAFVAASRMVFVAVEDTTSGRCLLLPVKNNLGALPPGLGYRLAQRLVTNGVVGSHVLWDNDPVTVSANEALAASREPEDRSAKAEAMEFLRDVLADGELPVRRILELATDAGLEPLGARKPGKPLRAAREALRIKPHKSAVAGGWVWSLPKKETQGV
jgi:putative DNA primase/helicase